MIGQTEVGLLSGKGPLIATFGYEKSDTRLYHFYRSNMVGAEGIEPSIHHRPAILSFFYIQRWNNMRKNPVACY